MQLACHKTLDDVLWHSRGSLDATLFLALLEGIAEGLSSLHRERIIHCDVKPDNIAVHEAHGAVQLWLIDLGDARLLDEPGSWRGRGPGAPEIKCEPDVRSGNFSSRTDAWCLAQCAAWLWNRGPRGLRNPAYLDQSIPLCGDLWRCLEWDARLRPEVGEIAVAAREALRAELADPQVALRDMLFRRNAMM